MDWTGFESYRLASPGFICYGPLGSVSRKRVLGILICVEILILFTKFYEVFVTKCWIFRWGGSAFGCILLGRKATMLSKLWISRCPENGKNLHSCHFYHRRCTHSFFFAFTKTTSILKLIYGKIIDFLFRTVLKYIVLCVVMLRCKQRWYEHCIILKRQVQVDLVILRLATIVGRYLGNHTGSYIHEHGAHGRMFPAHDGSDLFLLARTFRASSISHLSTHLPWQLTVFVVEIRVINSRPSPNEISLYISCFSNARCMSSLSAPVYWIAPAI